MSDRFKTNHMTEAEMHEVLDDFKSVAEDARFPPFSIPTNAKENDFVLVLSREFDEFVKKNKPYDSFDAVLQAYSEELVEARAWRSLGYSPEEAAREVIARGYRDAGLSEESVKSQTASDYNRFAKEWVMFADEQLPWGGLV